LSEISWNCSEIAAFPTSFSPALTPGKVFENTLTVSDVDPSEPLNPTVLFIAIFNP
jgi:hypothetical protein